MSEPITRERRMKILQSLGSTKCEGCGGAKPPKRSHCGGCYRRLPTRLKKALYLGFGKGYEEAFEESLSCLRGVKVEG